MDVGVIICIMIYKKKRQIIFVKWLKITKFYILKTELLWLRFLLSFSELSRSRWNARIPSCHF